MSGRLTADEKLKRSLAMMSWVVAEDGPEVEEVCRRFGYTPDELNRELEQLFVCGLYPFSPDTMVEAQIIDGRVVIHFPYAFNRPLRLSPQENLALLAATTAMLAEPGADRTGPLARGVAKLARLAGDDDQDSIEVDLGRVDEDVLATLRQAEAERRLVEIDYYSHGRDAHSTRTVAPWRVHNSSGQWYAAGWCHSVEDVRRFRLDRIGAVRLLDETFEPPAELPPAAAYTPRPGDPAIRITVPASDRWIVDQYPADSHDVEDDGSVTVTLRISADQWLDRLLLRLGTAARVSDDVAARRRQAAQRVLARYRD